MSRFGWVVILLLGGLLSACQKPQSADVIGTWTNPDGAMLRLEHNGEFSAERLPEEIFLAPGTPGLLLTGRGRWRLEKDTPYWEIELMFEGVLGYPERTAATVLVSGSGKSVGLYQWKGEEGGDRYKLKKK